MTCPSPTSPFVTLDCADPHALAAFYIHIVGGRIKQESATDEWVRLQTGSGCDLGFQRDVNHQRPDWPVGLPQQAHLDFDVADLDAAELEVLAIGATKHRCSRRPTSGEYSLILPVIRSVS
jgi:Glyoxalase-like domain